MVQPVPVQPPPGVFTGTAAPADIQNKFLVVGLMPTYSFGAQVIVGSKSKTETQTGLPLLEIPAKTCLTGQPTAPNEFALPTLKIRFEVAQDIIFEVGFASTMVTVIGTRRLVLIICELGIRGVTSTFRTALYLDPEIKLCSVKVDLEYLAVPTSKFSLEIPPMEYVVGVACAVAAKDTSSLFGVESEVVARAV